MAIVRMWLTIFLKFVIKTSAEIVGKINEYVPVYNYMRQKIIQKKLVCVIKEQKIRTSRHIRRSHC